jgi:hypothetical protein
LNFESERHPDRVGDPVNRLDADRFRGVGEPGDDGVRLLCPTTDFPDALLLHLAGDDGEVLTAQVPW